MYSLFLVTVHYFIDTCIPTKTVTLGPRDPDFVTPLVKSLLCKRRKLRRQGKDVEADALAAKINRGGLADDRPMSRLRVIASGDSSLIPTLQFRVCSIVLMLLSIQTSNMSEL